MEIIWKYNFLESIGIITLGIISSYILLRIFIIAFVWIWLKIKGF